jgi:hypothetical protein
MFCVPGLIFGGTEVIGSHFHVCASGHVFSGTEGVGSRFHVLRTRTHFRRYRGRRVPFSCFALPNSFSTVPSAPGPVFMFCAPDSFSATPGSSGPVFMFCAPEHVFSGAKCVGSHFHVLCAGLIFGEKRGYLVPFSCFALLEAFPAVPRALCLVFKLCAPILVFDGTAGIGSRFHIWRSRTCF